MDHETHRGRLQPKLISFDVFGTLISVRDSSYGAFERVLAAADARHLDVRAFWEHWEHRNIAHYWDPYGSYREICELSLAETFAHFKVRGDSRLIGRARTGSGGAVTRGATRRALRRAGAATVDRALLAVGREARLRALERSDVRSQGRSRTLQRSPRGRDGLPRLAHPTQVIGITRLAASPWEAWLSALLLMLFC